MLHVEGIGDGGIGHAPAGKIDPLTQPRISAGGGFVPVVRDLQRVRQRGIAQGDRARAADGAGHVGDAVVHHALYHVRRIAVRRRLGRLEASALVDADVYDYRTRFHQAELLTPDEHGRSSPREVDGAYEKVHFLKNLSTNAKFFGNQYDPATFAWLSKLVQTATNAEVRAAAGEAHGALNLPPEQVNDLILQAAAPAAAAAQ